MSGKKVEVGYREPVQYHEISAEKILGGSVDDAEFSIADGLEVNKTHVLKIKRRTVAIVVIPGIMASRLENEKSETIWDPDDTWYMLGMSGKDPDERYRLVINQVRRVMTKLREAKLLKKYTLAEERGWAGPSWAYYGKLLESLHNWDTPLKLFLDLPVYAFGYDWVRSNKDSGKALAAFVESLTPKPDKVIMVTHSMGGLVARAGMKFSTGLKEKVLGVIHGAQPVHGAPAAYRRQVAGTEYEGWLVGYLASHALGGDGPDITAIFPHAPGALELLPTQNYRTNDGRISWLHIEDPDQPGKFTSYPSGSNPDPYAQIYSLHTGQAYWGMVHEDWLLPDAPGHEPGQHPTYLRLKKRLLKAKYLHNDIHNFYHPRTLQLFSNSGNNPPTVSEICWQAKDITNVFHLKAAHWGEETQQNDKNPRLRDMDLTRRKDAGEYSELRWRGPNDNGIIPLSLRLEDVNRRLKAEPALRIFEFWLTPYGRRGPGMAEGNVSLEGDGTVPLSSARGLSPAAAAWGKLGPRLPADAGLPCSVRVSRAEHAKFYERAACRAAVNGVHNLCLGWLKGAF